MPELPEAETIVRGLRPALRGRRIVRLRIDHEDVLPQDPAEFRDRVRDRRVRGVSRRGKNVVLRLHREVDLVVNLGMTGSLLVDPPAEGPAASTHPALRFAFDDGGRLVYDDVRRFGRVEALTPDERKTWERRLGPEPLDPDFLPRDLQEALQASRSPVRSWLLDQRRIAGIGNIYANEALFRARIHPRRPARSLEPDEAEALHGALRAVLRAAIDAGGTTIRDFRDAGGRAGGFSEHLQVYDREGEPCLRCGTPVRRTVFGNRSAFHCPSCQAPAGGEGSAS